METYSFLKDEDELRWFFDHVFIQPDIGETYLASISARSKALTEEEKKEFKLGRSEMLHTAILKRDLNENISFEKFLSFIYSFNIDKRGLLTKANKFYPEESLVLYFYINPSSAVDVSYEMIEKILLFQKELLHSYINGSKEGKDAGKYRLSKMSTYSKTLSAGNISKKNYIDLDIDCNTAFLKKNYSSIHYFILSTFEKGSFFISETAGGWHILLKKEVVKINLLSFLNTLSAKIKALPYSDGDKDFKEAIINKNNFIQVPGCICRNHLVNIINKEDF